MANLDANVFTRHTQITLGTLRNGLAADVARTARNSSVAAKYYFSGPRFRAALRGNGPNRNPPCPAIVIFEAQWRSALSTIVEASVADGLAAHNAAAGVGLGAVVGHFDADAARIAAEALPLNRIEAIAIGAARTAFVASYNIVQLDLRTTESCDPMLVLEPPVAAADNAAYVALMRTATRGWTVALASRNNAGAATAIELVMLNAAALTTDEVELAFGIMALGQAALVRAGAQLYEDGHHYHSDAEGSSRHKAIEKEVTGKLTSGARNLWRANMMALRNAIWHAACHPVLEDVMQQLAEDPDIAGRLDATGYGSMSVGLPAQEDLFNRAGSYVAAFKQVVQTATAHGHEVSITKLTDTVTALSGLTRRGALVGMRPELPGKPEAPWPAGCNTRAKALKLYLEPALDLAEPVASWMFGFFREICSRNSIRASSQEGSLLRSYSLKRAVANYLGEANRASEMYAARARFIRAQGEMGNLEKYAGTA